MSRLKEKVMGINFSKLGRRFFIAVILFAVMGSVLSGVLLRTQIGEAITVHQTMEQTDDHQYEFADEQRNRNDAELDGEHKREYEHEQDWEDVLKHQLTPISTGTKVALASIFGIGIAFAAAYWLLVAAWLYQAAYRAKMKCELWLLAGLLGNVLAVLVFLLVRSFLRIQCSKCGSWQQKNRCCTDCGAALEQECPSCHTVIHGKNRFCPNCGKQIVSDQDTSRG